MPVTQCACLDGRPGQLPAMITFVMSFCFFVFMVRVSQHGPSRSGAVWTVQLDSEVLGVTRCPRSHSGPRVAKGNAVHRYVSVCICGLKLTLVNISGCGYILHFWL